MNLQDALLKFFDHRPLQLDCLSRNGSVVISKVDARWITEELMPIIERILAAERAALHNEWIHWCQRNLPQKQGGYTENWPDYNRSALADALAQARREQQEMDCAAVDAGYAKWERDSLCHESGCGCVTEYIKLAIRDQFHETQKA